MESRPPAGPVEEPPEARAARAAAALAEYASSDTSAEAFLARHPDLRDLLEPALILAPDPPTAGRSAMVIDDRYELRRQLGKGSMGAVFEAYDRKLERRVAIKLLRPLVEAESEARLRFDQEARLMARLHHEGIVPVFEVGEFDDRPYLVMQFVDAVPLSRLLPELRKEPHLIRTDAVAAALDRIPPVPPDGPSGPRPGWDADYVRLAVGWTIAIARALDHAHRAGLIHRDVKPSNILITRRDGRALLTDFGLARERGAAGMTLTGQFAGTPAYASPEHFGSARDLDARGDVFSLGVVLYEMLALHSPFLSDSELETRERVQRYEPRPLSAHNPRVPRDLAAVVSRALEKDRAHRYRSADEFAEDLARWLGGRPVVARPVPALVRMRRWAARNPLASAFLATLFLAVVAVSVLAWRIEMGARETERLLAEREVAATRADVEHWWRETLVPNTTHEERIAHLRRLVATGREFAPRLTAFEDRLARLRAAGSARAADRAHLPAYHPLVAAHADVLEQEAELEDLVVRPYSDEELDFLREIHARAKARRAELEEGLATLRTVAFAAQHDQRSFEELEDTVLRLRDAVHRQLPRIERRLGDLESLAERSVRQRAAEWDAALAAIAKSDRYHGMPPLRPQVGLVPLGPDPDSGLHEFAVLDTGKVPARDGQGRLMVEDGICIVLVLVPGGTPLVLERPSAARSRDRDPIEHEVEVAPFLCSKFEISMRQLDDVVGRLPLALEGDVLWRPRTASEWVRPAVQISWHSADLILRHLGLALPTGAQWNHACACPDRRGHWPGDPETVHTVCNVSGSPRPYGRSVTWPVYGAPPGVSARANPFGLWHIHGNVGEWLADLDGEPTGGPTGLRHTRRRSRGVAGGSCITDPRDPKASTCCQRYDPIDPTFADSATVGVRAVRAIDP